MQVAVKRLRVLDLDDTVAPNEQYARAGSGSSTQSSSGGEYGGANSGRAMGASQAAFRQFFEREIAILASIRHPNVVNFIGACHKPGQRCLVTEYCARGSLDQVLHKSGECWSCGASWLHGCGVFGATSHRACIGLCRLHHNYVRNC